MLYIGSIFYLILFLYRFTLIPTSSFSLVLISGLTRLCFGSIDADHGWFIGTISHFGL